MHEVCFLPDQLKCTLLRSVRIMKLSATTNALHYIFIGVPRLGSKHSYTYSVYIRLLFHVVAPSPPRHHTRWLRSSHRFPKSFVVENCSTKSGNFV